VSLLVSHAGGAAEAGPGHERFFVTADDNGSSTARSVNASDRGGVNFVVSAPGASGNAAFKTSCGSETTTITAKDAMN